MKPERLKHKKNIEELLNWLYNAEQESIKSRKEFDACGAIEMGGVEFGKECAYNNCRLKAMEIFKINK